MTAMPRWTPLAVPRSMITTFDPEPVAFPMMCAAMVLDWDCAWKMASERTRSAV